MASFSGFPSFPLSAFGSVGASQADLHTTGTGPSLVVFSGGTAFNSAVGPLRELTDRVAYVLPVSDDGGSTVEIVRVLGGPAVGDIRSRCLRLADESDEEAQAVKTLLAHRLPLKDQAIAKLEWYSIMEGDSALWEGVTQQYKQVIRAFLVHFYACILQTQPDRPFDFRNGNIGNFFFAGARNFFRSMEAAIFLFSRVARLPLGSSVLPAICTEERITLGAELADGTVVRGQNQISHPPSADCATHVTKSGHYDLMPSPVLRVFYLSSQGSAHEHEVTPQVNPMVAQEVEKADAIVYGMGSLYTSICPIMCLGGMGEAIAARQVPKILCLNGSHDRETASYYAHDGPMTACDMVQAITDAANRRRNLKGTPMDFEPSDFVDGVLFPRGGSLEVDRDALACMGVKMVLEVESVPDPDGSGALWFEPEALVDAIKDMIALLAPLGS